VYDRLAGMSRTTGILSWIIAFKALEATTLTALGVALLSTRRADPVDLFIRFAVAVHLPLTSRLLDRVLALAANLTITKQTTLAITAFAYAALMGAEGCALYLRKPWARWFTIIATSSLVPIEVYEIVRKPHLTRVLVLVVNVAIVIYLWQRRDLLDGQ
jgi:uncharacterized membrane protein (DUF2068 family)